MPSLRPLRSAIVVLLAVAAATTAALAQGAAAADAPAAAGAPATAEKLPQFVAVLRLVPRLHDDAAWTEADRTSVSRHFARLQAATASGQVILAGRTLEPGAQTFGLVIFEAADAQTAHVFMAADPCVAGGQMTVEVHPYAVVLQRQP